MLLCVLHMASTGKSSELLESFRHLQWFIWGHN